MYERVMTCCIVNMYERVETCCIDNLEDSSRKIVQHLEAISNFNFNICVPPKVIKLFLKILS